MCPGWRIAHFLAFQSTLVSAVGRPRDTVRKVRQRQPGGILPRPRHWCVWDGAVSCLQSCRDEPTNTEGRMALSLGRGGCICRGNPDISPRLVLSLLFVCSLIICGGTSLCHSERLSLLCGLAPARAVWMVMVNAVRGRRVRW